MNEYTLDFLEAVKALDEGRCEGIRSPNDVVYNSKDGCLKHKFSSSAVVNFSIQTLLGKWSLVGVKPRTEQRTIKYWLVVWKDGVEIIYYHQPQKSTYDGAQHVIPLSTTYTFTLPEED